MTQKHYWENYKITDHKYWFWVLKITVFLAATDYLVRLLNNHLATLSTKNFENISNFEGWGLSLVAYKKYQCMLKIRSRGSDRDNTAMLIKFNKQIADSFAKIIIGFKSVWDGAFFRKIVTSFSDEFRILPNM